MGLTNAQKIANKLAKKLEKQRVAAETKKRRKREELGREVAAHLLWKDQLDVAWRDAMLKVKIPVYRQKIEVMCHTFDRAYDKKDGLIHHLIYLREIANTQYHRTLGNYCVSADQIIASFLSDLENMCDQNDIKTVELLKFGRDELVHYMADHKKAETYLQLMLYTSHHAADYLLWNTHGDNVVRRDEDSSTYHEIRDSLSTVFEGTYYLMWEEYKSTLKGYISKTAENQKLLRKLRKKEQMMADIIMAQAKKLISIEGVVRRLRVELLAYESGEKQAGYRDCRNRHRDACRRLKNCMDSAVDIDIKQICTLVKASDDAVEWIEAAQKKCDKILRLAAQCRKHETQREKVLPYGSESPKEQIKMYTRMHFDNDPLMFTTFSSTCGLVKIWQRISNAELSKKALVREKTFLERENAILERKLSEQNKENLGAKAKKCACADPYLKQSPVRPCAVEGTLEMKKITHSLKRQLY